MHMRQEKIQHNGLGFFDKITGALTGAAKGLTNIAQQGADIAETGKGVYDQYVTVFSPTKDTPTGVPSMYTQAPYGGLPNYGIQPTSFVGLPPGAVAAGASQTTGLTAAQIMFVQKALNERGYNAGAVDGIVGPNTRAAAAAFQKDNNLTPQDGTVTRGLHDFLMQAPLSPGSSTAGGGMNNLIIPLALAGGALLLMGGKKRR